MWTFLLAGIVYLIGVAIILMIRPSYMFTPDGLWKEFGIEKGDEYTLCPFWLFCIVWAFVSYCIVIVLYKEDYEVSATAATGAAATATAIDISKPVELPKGYYVLNNKATKLAGVPKYVYLGEENPNSS